MRALGEYFGDITKDIILQEMLTKEHNRQKNNKPQKSTSGNKHSNEDATFNRRQKCLGNI